MSDIATLIVKDSYHAQVDWTMDGPDLESDGGLFTAIILSLMTDRQAAEDDFIPDAPIPGQGVPGIADRRGWWGDTALPQTGETTDLIGSRLWLLQRAPATPRTAALVVKYCQEALAWMIEDGVAQIVTVQNKYKTPDALATGILISRMGANGQPVNHAYDLVWAATNNVLGTADQMVLHDTLTSETGQTITDEYGRAIDVN